MTPSETGVKRITIRWSEDFWEAVSIAATKRRTSVQAIVTEAVSEKLGIAYPSDENASSAA